MARFTTQEKGAWAENFACKYLKKMGLFFLEKNVLFGRKGEIDLIFRDSAGTIIFVEVRYRSSDRYGGAISSVNWSKQEKIRNTAQYYLSSVYGDAWPAVRFDVCVFEKNQIYWISDAF